MKASDHKDILDRNDIKFLVDAFYEKVKNNPVLGYIFNDVAKVDWPHHLPRMYAFWSSVIFSDATYNGNPMEAHIKLSRLTPLTEKEFNEWLKLFYATVDENFSGSKADEAKTRATNIARLMLFKINQ
jgi:hemoglobin